MARSYLSAVLGVVVKIPGLHQAVLVADQPVSLDLSRIELHLELDVLCHGKQRAAQLLHQHPFRFHQAVHISVLAVSVVRQRFHLVVLDISRAKAHDGQKHAALLFLLDQAGQIPLAGETQV